MYTIGDLSILVVRSAEDEIKVFYNSCTAVPSCAATALICKKFVAHSTALKLDGSLDSVPGRWDFPQLSEDSHRLQSLQVGRWGGFVFINPNPNAGSLEDYLEDLPTHLEACGFEDMFIAGYYRKVLAVELEGVHRSVS